MSGGRQAVHHDNETSMRLYAQTSYDIAGRMLAAYSSSFGAGARLLGAAARDHIAALYGLVRVADEVVDTYLGDDALEVLDALEAETLRAIDGGFSVNPLVYAFGQTASACGIGPELVRPFFASMRADLTVKEHDERSFAAYVYGSAEVIGEMCLLVFVATEGGGTASGTVASEPMRAGARRLGAAYQKVNFLRDLAMDDGQLGRSYFPGVTAANLDDDTLHRLLKDATADLDAARECLPLLPRRARIAVGTTVDIYASLVRRIGRTPARELRSTRVRVPDPIKLSMAARNLLAGIFRRRRTT